MKKVVIAAAIALVAAVGMQAQELKLPALSPTATLSQEF